MRQITASAPGKIHFLGEHSVVYEKPALLAAVNLRCHVLIQEDRGDSIEIISKNLNQKVSLSVEEILEKQKNAQEKWEQYRETLDLSILQGITHSNPLEYAVIVIGEVLYYCHPERSEGPLDSLANPQNDKIGGCQIIIDSQIPIGSGLGSSSAIAVSLTAALISFLNMKYDKAAINEIALRAEQKIHGFPSGADVATSVYGGLMWFKKNGDHKIIEPLRFKIPEHIRNNFLIADSGKPEESTGEMVSYVKKLSQEHSETFEKFLELQGDLTVEMGHALKNGSEKKLMEIIKVGEANLESIGVVSEYVKQIIREIENSTGVAKICGGGGRKNGTGMLLCYHPDPYALQDTLSVLNLPFFQVELGCKGVTTTPH